MNNSETVSRIEFCDFLRAVAIIIVVLAHYIIGFSALNGWLYNPGQIDLYDSFAKYLKWLDGAYGVSIFFLISGFLIPISLNKYGSRRFLIQRLFRLVPTYAVCLLVVVAFSLYFGTMKPSAKLIQDYFLNITMNRDILGGAILDSVIWTLEIEMKFYLYLATLFCILKKHIPYCPWFNIVLMSIITITVPNTNPKYIGSLSFMFVGVSLYLLAYGSQKVRFWGGAAIPFNLFLMDYNLSLSYQSPLVTEIYYTSVLIFTVSMVIFYKFQLTTHKIIKYIANISYPLYAVHAIGYLLISWLAYKYALGILALPITLCTIIVICHFIHKKIETKSIALGKCLSLISRNINGKSQTY